MNFRTCDELLSEMKQILKEHAEGVNRYGMMQQMHSESIKQAEANSEKIKAHLDKIK